MEQLTEQSQENLQKSRRFGTPDGKKDRMAIVTARVEKARVERIEAFMQKHPRVTVKNVIDVMIDEFLRNHPTDEALAEAVNKHFRPAMIGLFKQAA